MPLISVTMPAYNTRESYLRAAIESILRQSFVDYEFIIVNDSPENPSVRAVVDSYRDARIKYVENPTTLGVAQSYNRLLELAAGKYIAMMNHDDIALPERLAKQYAYLESCPEVGLVGTGYKKFGEINRFKTVRNPVNDAEIRASLLFKSPIHHPTIMFRRSLIEQHHIRYNENFISLNDRQFYYDIGQEAKLANLPEILYRYRFHKDMVSKRNKPAIFREQCAFHEFWLNAAGMELSPKEKEILDNYVSQGRCHIKDRATLAQVGAVLDKLAAENRARGFVPAAEFEAICARYLVKRCLNAAVYGGINSAAVLKKSRLPVQNGLLLKVCNLALHWRGAEQVC